MTDVFNCYILCTQYTSCWCFWWLQIYNRIATALVTFETMWFQTWKSKIDSVRAGLKATLLVHHPDTREILVNADNRLFYSYLLNRYNLFTKVVLLMRMYVIQNCEITSNIIEEYWLTYSVLVSR